MGAKEKVQHELSGLLKQGNAVLKKFQGTEKLPDVRIAYQSWYSKAMKVMQLLAPERYEEFRRYYEADPKRKGLGYGTYVIRDYIKGVAPGSHHLQDFDTRGQAALGVYNQLIILASVIGRSKAILADIQGALWAELQDDEVDTAEALLG